MRNIFKNLFIPSGDKTKLVAYNSWIVRWKSAISLGSDLYANFKDQAEIFPSEIDAIKFAQSLKDARKLLRDTHFTVTIEENQSKLATLAQ